LAAVLFDMDGTLVDTEKVWQAALGDLADHHGGTLSTAAMQAVLGTTTAESMAITFADLARPDVDQAEAGVWLEKRVMQRFAAGEVVWRPGARQLLDAARAAGVPTALVTATARHLTEVILDAIGRHRFDVIITQDDVARSKPDPEPYATAAARLGVPASCCVAIEDSPAGVASARSAGCAVLAVPSEMDLPRVPAVTFATTLAGVDLPFLRALIAR
jgi:HAD superfamily hydrolase (TIGR01509 family)